MINLSIETDRGKIKVNENYQTNIENIYASGDVIGGIQLAHVATAECNKCSLSYVRQSANLQYEINT